MTTLQKNHPFIVEARRLEAKAAQEGASPEVIQGRLELKTKYPELYDEFMRAKRIKEEQRLHREKLAKKKQIDEMGGETLTAYKEKVKAQQLKNRLS